MNCRKFRSTEKAGIAGNSGALKKQELQGIQEY
jgi:hypothetical protein